METVAAGDEIAVQTLGHAVVDELDKRMGGLEGVQFDVGGFKENGMAGGQAGGDEILDDLVLRVDGDALARRQFAKIDTMALAVEAEFDAAMLEAFAAETLADSELMHQLNR